MPIRQQAINQLHNAESQMERRMTLIRPARFSWVTELVLTSRRRGQLWLSAVNFHAVICQVKARVSRARSGERANQQFQDVLRATVCLSASVPALGRTRHPFAVSGSEEPSPKIEFVFSASPETILREPREGDLLRSVGNMQDLAVCAFCSSCFFRQYFMPP
jgi:hypothetical protein